MCIVINVGHEKSYTKIYSYNEYEPYQRRDTTTAKCSTVSEHKDTICAHQPKDRSRGSYADFLGHEVETGDDAYDTRQKINQQVAQVSNQSIQEHSEHHKVEHVQPNVQEIRVQEKRRHEAPVLPLYD